MRAYMSFFRIRFIHQLQYRAAAYAGIATQYAFGFIHIMLYYTFYTSNPSVSPMDISQIASYLWLQQAFLALYMLWFLDNEIFNLIIKGNVAYELSRPLDIYYVWFIKNCSTRLSKGILRCFPILFLAFLLPKPFKFSLPISIPSFLLFIVSAVLGFIVVVAYCMLIYGFTFYTISPEGVRLALVMIGDFLSGALIPLPFLPNWFTKVIYYFPFASMMNTPFRIYSGNISDNEAIKAIIVQIVWAIILITYGKILFSRTLRKVVVQGG